MSQHRLEDHRPLVRGAVWVVGHLPRADSANTELRDYRPDESLPANPRLVACSGNGDAETGLVLPHLDVVHARTLSGAL